MFSRWAVQLFLVLAAINILWAIFEGGWVATAERLFWIAVTLVAFVHQCESNIQAVIFRPGAQPSKKVI